MSYEVIILTLVIETLTSHVIKLTPILATILTSHPYNCWLLKLRMSVFQQSADKYKNASIFRKLKTLALC